MRHILSIIAMLCMYMASTIAATHGFRNNDSPAHLNKTLEEAKAHVFNSPKLSTSTNAKNGTLRALPNAERSWPPHAPVHDDPAENLAELRAGKTVLLSSLNGSIPDNNGVLVSLRSNLPIDTTCTCARTYMGANHGINKGIVETEFRRQILAGKYIPPWSWSAWTAHTAYQIYICNYDTTWPLFPAIETYQEAAELIDIMCRGPAYGGWINTKAGLYSVGRDPSQDSTGTIRDECWN